MSDANPSDKPSRRPRYRGPNPRRFDEKYKEHQPDRYAEDVAKVIAGGRTPAGSHLPIMVREILDVLAPRPGELAVDATLGYGGHARELLASIQPGGRLIALDVDPTEAPKTEARLRSLGFPDESLTIHRRNFASLPALIATEAPQGVDMILADLGLSSMQIDDPARGFTFKAEGPLDMRMDPTRGRSAAELLAQIAEPALARILSDNADEPRASDIAAAIVRARARSPLQTTHALAQVVRAVYGRRPEDETADAVRRVFQAIRIQVNDEFGSLDAFLRALPRSLRPGGRVAILTFHSGEDRRVKAAFRDGFELGHYSSIAKDVTRASAEERRANPRSSSAKLRFATRSNIDSNR